MKIKLGDIFSKRNWFVFGLVFVLGAITFLIFFYSRGADLYNAYDSSGIVAGILICLAGLFFVIECGVFDSASYGFANFFSFRKDHVKKYKSLYDYKESKRVNRSGNIYLTFPILFAGIVFVIAAVILYFVWNSTL